MKPEVVEHNGLMLDISQVKCFKYKSAVFDEKHYNGEKYTIIVEFKTRYDYIKHPETGKYIKQKYNETVECVFYDMITAQNSFEEWGKIWRKYLESQS